MKGWWQLPSRDETLNSSLWCKTRTPGPSKCNHIPMGGGLHLGKPSFWTQQTALDKLLTQRVIGGSWDTLSLHSAVNLCWPVNKLYFLPKSSSLPKVPLFVLSRAERWQAHRQGEPRPSVSLRDSSTLVCERLPCCKQDTLCVCSPHRHTSPHMVRGVTATG